MDENLPATCSNCFQKLTVRDPLKPRGSKIPLILKCSHTICERCLMTAVRERGSITCAKCQHESKVDAPLSTWSKWENTLADSYPLNLYLLGSIAAKYQHHVLEDSNVRFIPAGAPANKYAKKNFPRYQVLQKPNQICIECEKEAVWLCKSCNDLYCNQCFLKCHQFKSQRKHEKIALAAPSIKPKETDEKGPGEIGGCAKHGGQRLDFFCANCDLYCCSYCVAVCEPEHLGHTVRPMSEVAKEIKLEMLIAKEEGNAQLELLFKMDPLLNNSNGLSYESIPEMLSDPELKKAAETIVNHFAWAHAKLQTVEMKMLKDLVAAQEERTKITSATNGKLQELVNDLSCLLQEADKALKKSATIDMVTITKRLRELKDMAYIVKRSDPGISHVRFLTEQTFEYAIDTHCTLEIPPPSECTLENNPAPLITPEDINKIVASVEHSVTSLPVVAPSIPHDSRASSYSPSPSLHSQPSLPSVAIPPPARSQSVTSRSSRASSVTGSDVVRPRTAAHTPVRGYIRARTSEPVKVCHITDLSSFYILRVPDAKFLDDLSTRIQKSVSKHRNIPNEINENSLYLVEYGKDGKWYRGRVRAKAGDMVEVVYVDYGNTERVSKTKLRNIPKEFTNIQPMAIHCALANIHPVDGKWSKEAIELFFSIVDGVTLLCRVFSVEVDLCYVDLGQLPGDDANNIPLSISDALLFLEFGQMVDSSPMTFSAEVPFVTDVGKTAYIVDKDFTKSQTLEVVVSHVVSPSLFYVQRMGTSAKCVVSLANDLNASYFQPPSPTFPLSNRPLFSPAMGMVCAAQFTTDNKWYRAQVIGLPGLKQVEVQYVDYGNKEVIPYTNLRRLSNKLLRIPVMAIACTLCDVVPPNGEWLPAARDFLSELTREKVLQMFINDTACGEENTIEVTLFEFKDEADICLNAELVKNGHAVSKSISSSANCVEYLKPSMVLSTAAKQTMFAKPKNEKPATKQQPASQPVSGEFLDDATVEEPEIREPDPYKLEVKVLKAYSPESIYVAVKCQWPHIENMIEEMQTVYNKEEPPVEMDWKPDMNCVCQRTCDGKWYRGIIKQVTEEGKVMVALIDIADMDVVPPSKLRELKPQFQTVPEPVRCRLTGIDPTGGTTKWSKSACEFVEEFLKKYTKSIFISKQGIIELRTLPVELFVCESYTPGPLDPTEERWFTLNDELVAAGLAIPKRGVPKIKPTPVTDVMRELEASYEQQNDGQQEWMAAVPQPKVLWSEDNASSQATLEDLSVDGESISNIFMRQGANKSEEETLSKEWLPSTPMDMLTFHASPTYVDDEGFIYLHDYEISMPLVKQLQAELQAEFGGSFPKPHDLYWRPGQLCTAQYHLDEHWYRGQVLQYADSEKVIVSFVDYGNIETCDVASQLRKCAFKIEVPKLAHKCYLYNIGPIGKEWTTAALDFLHSVIVDQRCNVTRRSEPRLGKPLKISLTRSDGLDIARALVENQHAKFLKVGMPTAGKSEDPVTASVVEPTEKSHEVLCAMAGHPLVPELPGGQVDAIDKVDKFLADSNGLSEGSKNGSLSIELVSTGSEEVASENASESDDELELSITNLQALVGRCHRPASPIMGNVAGANPLLEKATFPISPLDELEPNTTDLGAPVGRHPGPTSEILGNVPRASSLQEKITLPTSPLDKFDSITTDLQAPVDRLPGSASEVSGNIVEKTSWSHVFQKEAVTLTENVPGARVSVNNWYDEVIIDDSKECLSRNLTRSPSPNNVFSRDFPGKNSPSSSSNHSSKDSYRVHSPSHLTSKPVSYHWEELPYEEEIEVTVLTVVNPSKVMITFHHSEEEDERQAEQFNLLMRVLQQDAPKQPQLYKPTPGKPCVACFTEDDRWYRAVVQSTNEEEDTVDVQYVDYANCEVVPCERVVEIKEEWTELPVQARECNLWQIVQPDHATEHEVKTNLEGALLQRRVVAVIKEREPLFADLLNLERNDFAYASLLETQLLLKLD